MLVTYTKILLCRMPSSVRGVAVVRKGGYISDCLSEAEPEGGGGGEKSIDSKEELNSNQRWRGRCLVNHMIVSATRDGGEEEEDRGSVGG